MRYEALRAVWANNGIGATWWWCVCHDRQRLGGGGTRVGSSSYSSISALLGAKKL